MGKDWILPIQDATIDRVVLLSSFLMLLKVSVVETLEQNPKCMVIIHEDLQQNKEKEI